MTKTHLSHAELLQLKRWNTPAVYNGWEQITRQDIAQDGFNLEETRDFMPQMGVMVGYAVTVVIEPSEAAHPAANPSATRDYLRYIAEAPGPKIAVVQDLDKPAVLGSFWGEVNSNRHRTLGCVGTITDGAIRDLDEMTNAGFKALARRLCVGHAHVTPVHWNCEVEVFGQKILPGQLIHADQHGFLVVRAEDAGRLLDATRFMDANETNTVIPAGRYAEGQSIEEILEGMEQARQAFGRAVQGRFGGQGEW